jgi:flavodoxin
MENILILFGPDSAANRAIVDEVKAACSEVNYSPIVKAASVSSIVDLATYDVILFGAEKTDGAVPKDFAEIARVCKGANFAGKCGGFFALGGEKPFGEFRAIMKQSDISLFSGEPVFSERANDRKTRIPEWIRDVSGYCKGIRDARE